MKVLIATPLYPPDIGGPATYSKLLFDELPQKGVQVEILSFGEVRKLPKTISHLAYFFKLLKKARGADIIFAQDTVSVGFPALSAAWVLGKRFFVRVPGDYAWEQAIQRFGVTDSVDEFQNKKHGWRVEFFRKIQKLTVNGAETVITPSAYFRQLVSRWVKNQEKVFCIYNGIDLATIPKSDGSYEPKTIISVGRLILSKGFDVLIDTLLFLPDWHLFIVGDGPEKKNLLIKVQGLGLSDRVTFLGEINHSELIKKIQACEIFILNTKFETFSFQCVEVMASGTPIITCQVGGLTEVIENGKEGILIKPDNKEMIVEAVQKISSDNDFREMIVRNAKNKAKTFSIERTVNNLLKLFSKT